LGPGRASTTQLNETACFEMLQFVLGLDRFSALIEQQIDLYNGIILKYILGNG
jgi:hypothetical protein